MDAAKQHWRNLTQNSVRFVMSIIVVMVALLTITLALPALQQAVGYGHDLSSGGLINDIRSYLRNPLAYLTQRSPGARGGGELTQSKHRALALGRSGVKPPHEQVLSNVRYAPPIPNYLNDLLPNKIAFPGIPPFDLPNVRPPASILNVPQGPPGVPVSSSNPGGGGGDGGTAVPEPSTWFMLIWGMGLVGFGLRAGHRFLAKGRSVPELER